MSLHAPVRAAWAFSLALKRALRAPCVRSSLPKQCHCKGAPSPAGGGTLIPGLPPSLARPAPPRPLARADAGHELCPGPLLPLPCHTAHSGESRFCSGLLWNVRSRMRWSRCRGLCVGRTHSSCMALLSLTWRVCLFVLTVPFSVWIMLTIPSPDCCRSAWSRRTAPSPRWEHGFVRCAVPAVLPALCLLRLHAALFLLHLT